MRAAVHALAAVPRVHILATSSVYDSPPVGPPNQPRYLNAVVKIATNLPPRELLAHLLNIERQLGRTREATRWTARTIDLDLVDDRRDGRIHLRVSDNGRGFVVGKQRGANEGHFGLQGMRERAERLGGTFTVTSRPGEGTAVEATVMRRDYDRQLDGQTDPVRTTPTPRR